MGLLDQILGGLTGGTGMRSPGAPGPLDGLGGLGDPGGPSGAGFGGRTGGAGVSGGGMQQVLVALLPVVLRMLAQRRSGSGGGMLGGIGASGGLGGLGGLAATGGAAGGGLGALLEQLGSKGYGSQVDSWVSTGENQPLPPEAIEDVFGDGQLDDIAQQAGVSREEARSGLSELLPQAVDHFTPEGRVPEMDSLSSSVDDYLRRLG